MNWIDEDDDTFAIHSWLLCLQKDNVNEKNLVTKVRSFFTVYLHILILLCSQ